MKCEIAALLKLNCSCTVPANPCPDLKIDLKTAKLTAQANDVRHSTQILDQGKRQLGKLYGALEMHKEIFLNTAKIE